MFDKLQEPLIKYLTSPTTPRRFLQQGDEAATSRWLEGVTSVRPKSFDGPLDRKGMTRSEIPINMVPGMPISAILREPRRWSKKGVADIKKEKYLLFHYGRGEYGDAAGNTYPIQYCLRYERGFPKTESGLSYMGLCERKFWPKELKKTHSPTKIIQKAQTVPLPLGH